MKSDSILNPEQEEKKPTLKFKQNSSDEELTTTEGEERGGILPKLKLDDNNDNGDSEIVSTHSHSADGEEDKPDNRLSSSCTQRLTKANTTLTTINEGRTESETCTPKAEL